MEKMTNVDQLILEFQIEADQYMMNTKYLPYMEDGNSGGFIEMIGNIITNIIEMIKTAIKKIIDVFTNAEAKEAVKNLNNSKALAKSQMMVDYEEYPYEDIRVLQNKAVDKIMAARSEQEVENILDKYKEAKEKIIKKKNIVKKIAIGAAAAAAIVVVKAVLNDNKLHKDIDKCRQYQKELQEELKKNDEAITAKENKKKASLDKKEDKAKEDVLGFFSVAKLKLKSIAGIEREACESALKQSADAKKVIAKCEAERKKIEASSNKDREENAKLSERIDKAADEVVGKVKSKTTKEKAKRAFSAAVLKADDVVKKTNSFLSDPFAGAREIINKREKEENEIRAEEARKAKEEAKKNKNKK